MIVLDASAAVDWLLQTPAGQRIEERIYARNDTLHTVYLLDVEFAQVLRRLVREGTLARKRAEEAMEDLIAVRVTRYAPVLLLNRIWQLRQNLTAYDAAYVALAEELEAPLITRDQRIAAAPGHTATIEVFKGRRYTKENLPRAGRRSHRAVWHPTRRGADDEISHNSTQSGCVRQRIAVHRRHLHRSAPLP